MTSTRTTLRHLSNLYNAARNLTTVAERRDMRQTAKQTDRIAKQLDATRTILVQEGDSYQDVALAYLDTCADRLIAHAALIGRCADREPCRVDGCTERAEVAGRCMSHFKRKPVDAVA